MYMTSELEEEEESEHPSSGIASLPSLPRPPFLTCCSRLSQYYWASIVVDSSPSPSECFGIHSPVLAERARVNIERRWHCAPN